MTSIILVITIIFIYPEVSPILAIGLKIVIIFLIFSTIISLIVSAYIYDFSHLYSLSWTDNSDQHKKQKIVNINAGFDETSVLIRQKFPAADLYVFDFYNPDRHTEVSIKRARRAYPPYPGTQSVSTSALTIESNSAAKIFCIFSAHEIRDDAERILFFNELHRILSDDGEIMITEHLRDVANFLVYNIGFFHFHSKSKWMRTFYEAGLNVSRQIKITPFITTFILQKNATSY
ncbi:MAG TPA: hypothetical protein VK664_13150 [Flavitalea sp.]|nr:hypothetical protein [Flavitalea sp.]